MIAKNEVPAAVQQPSVSFPSSSTTPASQSGTLAIAFPDGTATKIPDFTKGNQPAWAGDTGYLVAGSPTDMYMITYIPPANGNYQNAFTIVVQGEPLGEVRRAAETAFINKTGFSKKQICELGVSVVTQPGLSDTYDRAELGVSFCPGATVLP